MSDTYRPPRAPAGLGSAGRALWRGVVDGFELRPDELALLKEAALLLDELGALQAALDGAKTLTTGSRGQLRPNGLYSEMRSHRLALVRLMGALGLGDADTTTDGSRKSHAGRSLARLRWG